MQVTPCPLILLGSRDPVKLLSGRRNATKRSLMSILLGIGTDNGSIRREELSSSLRSAFRSRPRCHGSASRHVKRKRGVRAGAGRASTTAVGRGGRRVSG